MEGHVYFIRADKLRRVKIGYTTGKFSTRKHGIQTMSPVKLHCLGLLTIHGMHPSVVEKELHKTFDDYRIWGEWFEFPKKEFACLKKCFGSGEKFDYATFKNYWDCLDIFSYDNLEFREPNRVLTQVLINKHALKV